VFFVLLFNLEKVDKDLFENCIQEATDEDEYSHQSISSKLISTKQSITPPVANGYDSDNEDKYLSDKLESHTSDSSSSNKAESPVANTSKVRSMIKKRKKLNGRPDQANNESTPWPNMLKTNFSLARLLDKQEPLFRLGSCNSNSFWKQHVNGNTLFEIKSVLDLSLPNRMRTRNNESPINSVSSHVVSSSHAINSPTTSDASQSTNSHGSTDCSSKTGILSNGNMHAEL
jgi:hypothetical protein